MLGGLGSLIRPDCRGHLRVFTLVAAVAPARRSSVHNFLPNPPASITYLTTKSPRINVILFFLFQFNDSKAAKVLYDLISTTTITMESQPPADVQAVRHGKQYFCDCSQRCKGRRTPVHRTTYQRHAGFRAADLEKRLSRFGRDLNSAASTSTPLAAGSPLEQTSTNGDQSDGGATSSDSNLTNMGAVCYVNIFMKVPQIMLASMCQGLDTTILPDQYSTPTTITASDIDTDLLTNVNERPEGGVGLFPPDGDTPHGVPPTVGPADAGCLDEEQQDPAPSNYTTGLEELSNLAQLKDIKLTMEFIRALDGASLDKEDSRLDADTLHRLRNPPTSCVDLTDPDLRLGLDLFLASIKSSQDTYTMSRDAIIRRHPDDDIPTYDQMKRRIAEITGVVPIVDDMC